jgi:hypothetical protein
MLYRFIVSNRLSDKKSVFCYKKKIKIFKIMKKFKIQKFKKQKIQKIQNSKKQKITKLKKFQNH